MPPSPHGVLVCADIPEGSVEFRGADFSWGSRAWAGQTDILPGDTDSGAPAATSEDPKAISSNPEKALPAAAKTWDMEACGGGRNQEEQNAASGVNSLNAASAIYGAAAAASKKDYTAPLTLYSPEFTIAPGEFVGVAGEVGFTLLRSFISRVGISLWEFSLGIYFGQ